MREEGEKIWSNDAGSSEEVVQEVCEGCRGGEAKKRNNLKHEKVLS